jgi:hypothetical protein
VKARREETVHTSHSAESTEALDERFPNEKHRSQEIREIPRSSGGESRVLYSSRGRHGHHPETPSSLPTGE